MQYFLLASALAAAASAAVVTVDNNCSFDMYLTSTFGSGPNDGVHTLKSGTHGAFNALVTNDQGQQHALTISRKPDISSPLQNVYTVSADKKIVYYSLSTIYGDPLKSEGYKLDSQGNGFDIESPKGRTGDPANEYSPSNPNGNNAVFQTDDGKNFVLSLCL